jgi:UDP-N-acetylmuramyl-tripeptide synthetase
MALLELHSANDALRWLRTRGAVALTTDSRSVAAGSAFIAWPGYARDGRSFVAGALAAGAPACLVEADGAEAFGFDDDRIAALRGLKASTGEIASGFYGEPSGALDVVAVTGTNGKTSTSWWVAQALSSLGRGAGVVGTLGVGVPPQVEHTGLTTPDPVTLQRAFRGFLDQGLAAAAIEASSIGIVEQRLAGTRIAAALFTNFTRDHLDYHGSMEAYWAAKEALFGWAGLRAAVVNVDDDQGRQLATRLAGSRLDLWTYSCRQADARLCAVDVGYREGGLAFDLREGASTARVQTQLIGDYNVGNLLAVVGALRSLGVGLPEAAQACAGLTPVPGRMQRVAAAAGQPAVVVDYAHTPDALEKALLALRPFAQERRGALWCVFGCGGNRDATKRPLMGGIAERLADRVVVTSDNPRNETPAAILKDIVAGLARPADAAVIEDRRVAIGQALSRAMAGDVVLIAGKGHEDYQEIAGIKHAFSDVEEAARVLRARSAT